MDSDRESKHLIFLLLHGVVGPHIFTLYVMFYLNAPDDNDDV